MSPVKTWPVQDAKARFSELLDTCLVHGPQMISRRGVPEAVLAPLGQWQQLVSQQKTLKELLLVSGGRYDFDLPERGQQTHREIEVF